MSMPEQWLHFGPFRLDPQHQVLWKDNDRLALRPRALSVLCYLAERPGDLIPAQELMTQLWPGLHVTETVLRVCIRDIRHVLGDSATRPQYVQTVRGQGYRFCGLVVEPNRTDWSRDRRATTPPIVGHDQPLGQLHAAFQRALTGDRQMIFVQGEPGMGKTTLIDVFLDELSRHPHARIGRGQCIELTGETEAYMPILEVLGQLGQDPESEALVAVLHQAAPTWLIHLPLLVPTADREALARQVKGSTRGRMMRELVEAFDLLAAQTPLVLVLEDLHWSDPSTIDFLAVLARRRTFAQLFVIGSFRPLELILNDHPLHHLLQELEAHGQSHVIPLVAFDEELVSTYVEQRLHAPVDGQVTTLLYERSAGNALFLTRLMEDWVQRDCLEQREGQWHLQHEYLAQYVLPKSIRQMLTKQLEQFPPDILEVLEVASVAGERFTTAVVAAALPTADVPVNRLCEQVASTGQVLVPQGVEAWPDRTISGAYRFQHILYRQVLYERISDERCMLTHRRIGRRLEQGYRTETAAIVGQLAHHFAQGRQLLQALHYLHQAALLALGRSAATEAIGQLTTAFDLLPELPEGRSRLEIEYNLQATLASAMVASYGWFSPRVEDAYSRARDIAQRIDDRDRLFPMLVGLNQLTLVKAQYTEAQHTGEQLLRLARHTDKPMHLAQANRALCQALTYQGQWSAAHGYAEACLTLLTDFQLEVYDPTLQLDPFIICQRCDAQVLWALGYADQAFTRAQEALTRAQDLGGAFNVAVGMQAVLDIHRYCNRPELLYEAAETMAQHCVSQGLPFWEVVAQIFRGWALVRQGDKRGGIEQVEQGMAIYRQTGSRQHVAGGLALVAEAYLEADCIDEGRGMLKASRQSMDALGERWLEPEWYILSGTFGLRQGLYLEAEADFAQALKLSRQVQSKSYELRAAMGLAQIWSQLGKRDQARHLLEPIYNWFTEGFETVDLQQAKQLLASLTTD